MALGLAHQHQMPVVEAGEGGAVPDRHQGGTGKPGLDAACTARFRRLRRARRWTRRGTGSPASVRGRARWRAVAARRATAPGSSALPHPGVRPGPAIRPRSVHPRAARDRTSRARPGSSPRPPASPPGNTAAAASPSCVRPWARGRRRCRTAKCPRWCGTTSTCRLPKAPSPGRYRRWAQSRAVSAATSGWPFGRRTRRSPIATD